MISPQFSLQHIGSIASLTLPFCAPWAAILGYVCLAAVADKYNDLYTLHSRNSSALFFFLSTFFEAILCAHHAAREWSDLNPAPNCLHGNHYAPAALKITSRIGSTMHERLNAQDFPWWFVPWFFTSPISIGPFAPHRDLRRLHRPRCVPHDSFYHRPVHPYLHMARLNLASVISDRHRFLMLTA